MSYRVAMDIATNQTFTCYKITNTVNGKLYVGQTYKTLEFRWKRHVGDALGKRATERNVHALHRAIRKYGPKAFSIEPLEIATTLAEICLIERKYIVDLNTHVSNKRGYNMTLGGEGTLGYILTEEVRQKMSNAQRGKKRRPRTKEEKQRISETKKRLGHGPTKLCNQRRSETGKGIARSEDVKERIRATLKGRPRPPEVVAKILETKRKKKNA